MAALAALDQALAVVNPSPTRTTSMAMSRSACSMVLVTLNPQRLGSRLQLARAARGATSASATMLKNTMVPGLIAAPPRERGTASHGGARGRNECRRQNTARVG